MHVCTLSAIKNFYCYTQSASLHFECQSDFICWQHCGLLIIAAIMTTTTQLVSGKDASLDFTPGAITAPQKTIDELVQILKPEPPRTFEMYGKKCKMQRSQLYYSTNPNAAPYKFSRNEFPPMKVLPGSLVAMCIQHANTTSGGAEYNAALVNYYSDGSKFISPHSDDEGCEAAPIFTYSFGATRPFQIRWKGKEKPEEFKRLSVPLPSGSCAVMRGADFQTHFTHGIPATKKEMGWRISITVRSHF